MAGMLRVRWVVVGAVAVVGCKGPAGSDGEAGPPGPQGPFADAPRVERVEPDVLSPGLIATVRGVDFAVVTTANRVLVGGWEAEILYGDAFSITFRAAVPPDQSAEEIRDLVVISNEQPSNALPVRTVPSGTVISLRHGGANGVRVMAPRDDGSVFLLEDDRIVEVTVEGDLRPFVTGPVKPGARAAIVRNDGTYYLTATDVRRVADGADHRVWALPPGLDPRGMATDPAENLYVLAQGAASAEILKRDYVTFDVSTLTAVTTTNAVGLWQQGNTLFLSDVAAGQIVRVPVGAPVPANHAAMVTRTITGDGLANGLLYAFNESTRTVWRVDVIGGASQQWSPLTPGPLPVDQIAYGVGGAIFVRSGSVVWRQPDNVTFTTHVAPFPVGRAVGAAGSQVFLGSDVTCGVGDSKGGVLYRIDPDGVLRRMVSDFCGRHAVSFSPFTARVIYADALTETLFEIDAVGGVPAALAVLASGADPQFIATATDGAMYVGNWSAGGYRVTKLDSVGATIAADFVPVESEAPWSATTFGDDLVLTYPGSNRVRSVPLATGGVPAPYGDPAFRPDAHGISTLDSGRVVVTDVDGESLWAIDANGAIERIGDSPGESPWFDLGDGRIVSAGAESLDVVMP